MRETDIESLIVDLKEKKALQTELKIINLEMKLDSLRYKLTRETLELEDAYKERMGLSARSKPRNKEIVKVIIEFRKSEVKEFQESLGLAEHTAKYTRSKLECKIERLRKAEEIYKEIGNYDFDYNDIFSLA